MVSVTVIQRLPVCHHNNYNDYYNNNFNYNNNDYFNDNNDYHNHNNNYYNNNHNNYYNISSLSSKVYRLSKCPVALCPVDDPEGARKLPGSDPSKWPGHSACDL